MPRTLEKMKRSLAQRKDPVVFAKEFLRFGSRSTISRCMGELVRNGFLEKKGRGLYVIAARQGQTNPLDIQALKAMRKPHQAILDAVRSMPKGFVFGFDDFKAVVPRTTFDRAVGEFCRKELLFKVCRGMYCSYTQTEFGAGLPSVQALIEGISRKTGEVITPSGAMDANLFGLDNAFPTKHRYYTSGRTRVVRLGWKEIELKHASGWRMYRPNERLGGLLRAIDYIGKDHIESVKDRICSRVAQEEMTDLYNDRNLFPVWIKNVIAELMHAK